MNDSLSQLQAERETLETERDQILSAIRDLRQRARAKSIVAADTRQPLAQSEIGYWQRGISTHQAQLMDVQGKLGAFNKRLREQHANGSRTRQTREPTSEEQSRGTVYLSCFYQIAHDSLDPRVFSALERDARALARDYNRMHAQEIS